MVLKQSTEELTLKSDRILTGEVIEVQSEWSPDNTTIYTYVTVLVDQHIQGSPDENEVTIKIPGGTVGDISIKVSDVAQFSYGEKVAVFLEKDEPGYYRVRGWFQGKYTIKDNKILEKNISVESFITQIKDIKKRSSKFNAPLMSGITFKTGPKVKKNSLLPMTKQPAHMQLKADLAKEILKKKAISPHDTNSSIITKAAGWQNIMTENFEGTFPSSRWLVFDLGNYPGEYYWGKDDYKPYEGSYSAWCARSGANGLDPQFNNYPNYCESVAVYGPFDLSDANDAKVTLKMWAQTEYGYDFVWFFASIDAYNWYGEGFTGNSEGWRSITFDLTDVYVLGNLTGQPQVWIAAVFTSNNIYTYKGVFIDNIVLSKNVINHPPVLNLIGNKSITEGQLLSFTVSGSDIDGDPLTFSASNLPSGATFNPATRSFNWTPTYEQAGIYTNIHFEVTDGTATDSEDITITVNDVNSVINNISPNLGSAGTGTHVIIEGSYFGNTQNSSTATFFYAPGYSGIEADVISWSNEAIECIVPTDASSGEVKVNTYYGVSNGVQFTVTFGYAGVKWYNSDIPVPYYINENGTPDCVNEFTAVQDAFKSWENASGGGITFPYKGTTFRAGSDHNDGYNVISWGDVELPGAIAVTYIRFLYPGDRILETDMVFNNALTWSDSGESGKFDVQNIATHEAGHFLCLSDLYGDADSEKTMYGFGDTGETKKRSLEPDDIKGVLYIYPGQAPMVAADLDGNNLDDVVIDFGNPYGIWVRYNDSYWTKLHDLSPDFMVKGNIDGDIGGDDLIIDFGDPYGIWIRYNDSTWSKLHSLSPERMVTADINNDGKDEIVIDFGDPYGIWIWYPQAATWGKLHSLSCDYMVKADLDADLRDDLVVDFGDPYGIWIWSNNSGWLKLHALTPERMLTADVNNDGYDEIVVDFGDPYGIWVYYPQLVTWSKLHNLSCDYMVKADLDADPREDLVIDFGEGYGIWIWSNNSDWLKLHELSSDWMITGDMDNTGQDEVIIDFGDPYGIWVRYNNSSWTKLHYLSP